MSDRARGGGGERIQKALITMFISSTLWGKICDKFGRRKVSNWGTKGPSSVRGGHSPEKVVQVCLAFKTPFSPLFPCSLDPQLQHGSVL